MATRTTTTSLLMAALVVQSACAPGTTNTGSAGAESAATAGSQSDPDVRPVGATGLPSGYLGRPDRPDAQLADARYVVSGNAWEITTGPAHILWSNAHTASGSYTASATFEQLERPRHPEAFGIFIGGRDLNGAGQAYTYFLVRGTGEAFAQRRDGTRLTRLMAWSPSSAVPIADSAGRQTYRLQVQVRPDSVRFFVNGAQAVAVAAANAPADGIAGLRVNHNLRLRATPIQITRP